ncbi:DUF2481 domain-containing protein [Listeria monocytogenes serotype 1/2b]|nr:DUF2481 domain-containing protein [Listeria monocytogenes serotype 1/2b]
MTVLEITRNKSRQKEIINYITNNDLPLWELKELQRELNQLMNSNTNEKKKHYWDKALKQLVGNKSWNNITMAEFVEMKHAGIPAYAIADYFEISKATIFNFTQKNRKEYQCRFKPETYRKSRELWDD